MVRASPRLKFLGSTHACDKRWKDVKFIVLRQMMAERASDKLNNLAKELRRRMRRKNFRRWEWLAPSVTPRTIQFPSG